MVLHASNASRRCKQEDQEFKVHLGYLRPCLEGRERGKEREKERGKDGIGRKEVRDSSVEVWASVLILVGDGLSVALLLPCCHPVGRHMELTLRWPCSLRAWLKNIFLKIT